MSAFGHALLVAAKARMALLAHRGRRPRGTQERCLTQLLHTAKDTVFGREHGFSRIRSLHDYRERVPLRAYGALEPWLSRALRGEANVIWPGKIPYFAMSSGTTAGNKYLPISSRSVENQRRYGFDPIAAYVSATGDTTVLDGKAILLGSSATLARNEHGVLVGDNTGIMAGHMPRIVRERYLPSPGVRGLGDWDTKIDALARESVFADVRLVAGTPSWFPGLFERVLAESVHRKRPAERLCQLWPNLRLVTGGGINYEPYRGLVEARAGRSIPYVDVYNATEGGIMGVQTRLREPLMQLIPDSGVFYEFVPLSEVDAQEPRRFSSWEVETDVPYAVALGTPAGLFGYLLGDVIRFLTLFPHRFRFEGRTTAFLNLTGEHVSQGELERAVTQACRTSGAEVADFTVVPEVRDSACPSRHVYYVEFRADAPALEPFASAIDASLREKNEDYDVHRRSALALGDPLVRRVPAGTFHDFMKWRGKLGGQNKVPRVVTDHDSAAFFELLSQRGA